MEFTREKTNVAKGFAILLMFSNHLYAFPDRLLHGNSYIPLIPAFNLEFLIGNFGSVCVSIFLFLSGYGMYLGYKKSRRLSLGYSLNKLKDFYLTYWLYFLVFVPIGIFFFQNEILWHSSEIRYSSEFLDLLEGFSGWSARYNSEWWFVRMFVLTLLLLCPLYLSLATRNLSTLCLISSTLFLLSWISKVDYTGLFGIFFWQINFFMGILFARLNLYASPFFSHLDRYQGVSILLLGLFWDEIFFFLRSALGAKVDFLFVAIFIYFTVRLLDLIGISEKLLGLGKYSFQLWLVHSFFCYYFFQDFIYSLRWSPLIFIILLSTSLFSVLLIENLQAYVKKRCLSMLIVQPESRDGE